MTESMAEGRGKYLPPAIRNGFMALKGKPETG
jgi:hypothetical protein